MTQDSIYQVLQEMTTDGHLMLNPHTVWHGAMKIFQEMQEL